MGEAPPQQGRAVGLAYAAGVWGLQQGIAFASGLLRWPYQVQWLSGLALLLALAIAMTLAWYDWSLGE